MNFQSSWEAIVFKTLTNGKTMNVIIKNYPYYVYLRPGFEVDNNMNAKLTIGGCSVVEISATHIRQLIKEGKSIRYMVPDKVREEIEKGGYYKK